MSAPPFARALPRLLILALAVCVGFGLIGSFSTVQEAAKAELGLSDVQLGLIQGVGTAVPLVLLSVPIGVLVDRGNRLRLMVVFALLSVAGTLVTAIAVNVATLFVARMLAGVAMAGGLTAALSIAADLCAPDRRGWAVFILNLGKSLGQAAGFALTGWLFGWLAGSASWFGAMAPWRGTHLVLAGIGALASVPLLLMRESPRHEVEAGPGAPFRIVLAELWARRRFLLPLFVGQMSVVMADAAAVIWAAPVLTRSYALAPQAFAGWMGGLLLFVGVIGGAVGGGVAGWGARRGQLLIGAVIAAAVSIPAALFPIAPSVPLFALALGMLILTGAVTGLLTSVSLTTLLPNELRGLSIGAFLVLAGLIGFGLAPPLVSWVSLLLGGESRLGLALAAVGVGTGLLSVAGFVVAMRRSPAGATHTPIG